jgi:hypothetical protein
MKKVIFVVSHLASGSTGLIALMNRHPRMRIFNLQGQYKSPLDLEPLLRGDEFDHAGMYCGDHLLFNPSFCCKSLYESCNFIYAVRPPKPTLNLILSHNAMAREQMRNYYLFRIRRIYEMARRTPGAVLLTWNDMMSGAGLKLIEDYLGLKKEIQHEPRFYLTPIPDLVDASEVSEVEDRYEYYLYRLKQLDLRVIR